VRDGKNPTVAPGDFKELYRRRRHLRLIRFSLPPTVVLILLLTVIFQFPFVFLIIPHMILWPILSWRYVAFPCPRCGKPFKGYSFIWTLPDRCRYCGLPRESNQIPLPDDTGDKPMER